jgi:hypothetical protein
VFARFGVIDEWHLEEKAQLHTVETLAIHERQRIIKLLLCEQLST